MDSQSIKLEASMDANRLPIVIAEFEGHSEIYTPESARLMAIELNMAAAIAQHEAAIFNGMKSMDKKSRGFTKPSKDDPAVHALALLRQFREPLNYGIRSIFGFNTRRPIVIMPWLTRDEGLQFTPDTAKDLASNFNVCAEAAETDGFLRDFVAEVLDMGLVEAQGLIKKFRQYRERVVLERSFSADSP